MQEIEFSQILMKMLSKNQRSTRSPIMKHLKATKSFSLTTAMENQMMQVMIVDKKVSYRYSD